MRVPPVIFPRRKPRPKPRPKPPPPRPRPVPKPVDKGPVPNPGGTTTPAPPSTTTTTTDATGLPGSAAGQLAQDAGQLEGEQAAAAAYETQQPMVTTPSTTAPASAYQDSRQDRSNDALQSFFSTGAGDAVHYHPGQTYATEVAASTGMENNPT